MAYGRAQVLTINWRLHVGTVACQLSEIGKQARYLAIILKNRQCPPNLLILFCFAVNACLRLVYQQGAAA